MNHTNSLQNKVAIVSGGGSGIGRGIALALVEHGAKVVVCGRRLSSLEATRQQAVQAGGSMLVVQADVSQESEVQELVDKTIEAFGRVDILINNAGISVDAGPVHQIDLPSWDRSMEVNLRGPLLCMQAALPVMRKQHSGHIINISSESGLEYYREDTAYGLSKHALNDLGEYTQRENQDANIRVNTICPGMVISEMTENLPDLDHEKCLFPQDIADLVIFLLTRRENIKIGTPILIQTMLNPWE